MLGVHLKFCVQLTPVLVPCSPAHFSAVWSTAVLPRLGKSIVFKESQSIHSQIECRGIKLCKLNTFGSFILQLLCMHRSDSGSIIRNHDYYNYTVTVACYNDNNHNYNVLKNHNYFCCMFLSQFITAHSCMCIIIF